MVLKGQLTGVWPLLTCWAWTGILSDGNGRFATCHHGGATPESPLTGRCGACRCYQYTEWRGCRQCRQPLHPPGGCEGSGWWCGQVCCFWTTLEETQGFRISCRVPSPQNINQTSTNCYELTVFKIKAVEVETLNQIPQGFRLKRRHGRVAHFTEKRQTKKKKNHH